MKSTTLHEDIIENAKAISPFDRMTFTSLRFMEHFAGRRIGEYTPVKNSIKKLYAMNERSILKKTEACSEGGFFDIDQYDDLSPEKFRQEYLSSARPMVFRGAAKNWPCTRKWSPEYFGDKYGDDQVILINDHIATDESVEETITLREIIDNLDSEKAKYARFVPILDNHPELFDDFDTSWLSQRIHKKGLVKLWGNKGKGTSLRSHLFIGRKNAKTDVHCALTNNFFVNVYGKKRWFLISPEYNPMIYSPVNWGPGVFGTEVSPLDRDDPKHPLWKHVKGYMVTLNPGDVLFNPPFWWHHVTNITDSVAIGIRWYDVVNAMTASSTQNILSMLATNPSMISAALNAVEYGNTHQEKKRKDLRITKLQD
jgi:hypothetical protein